MALPELVLMAVAASLREERDGAVTLHGAGAPVVVRPMVLSGTPVETLSNRIIVFGFRGIDFDGEVMITVQVIHPNGDCWRVYQHPLDFDGSQRMQWVEFDLPSSLPGGMVRYQVLLDGTIVGELPVWVTSVPLTLTDESDPS